MSAEENRATREALIARLDDLCEMASRGELGISSFLSPREQHYAKKHLEARGVTFLLYGGHADAERKRVYLLPDYIAVSGNESEEELCALLADYGFSLDIFALKIVGSGYYKLTHRDYLGSLLGLGIERDVVGDICVLTDDGREAVILCDGHISEFVLSDLLRVARDKISVSRIALDGWKAPVKRVVQFQDTVASPRLDAVVAALCNLSRESARQAVVSGLCEIDFEGEERPDFTLTAPCVLSVRGIGRFTVLSLDGRTKKGRLRLIAEKYV